VTFDFVRHRRLRQSAAFRALVRETALRPEQLVYPLFVTEGAGVKREIPSMPGVYHLSLDLLAEEAAEAQEAGVRALLLFGVPDRKDERGSSAWDDEGVVQRAIRTLKRAVPDVLITSDPCLCQYTSHGHCGIVEHNPFTDRAEIANDPSLELHVKTAVSQAKAGADVVAPSNMMDGFAAAIRRGLDEHGLSHAAIMAYSVKYASAFYGPFREAARSAPQFGDRKTYQMDPANVREALREAASDVAEGADFLMVKPALAYMDVIRALRERFDLPVAAYNTSAEYSMVKAAAANGWIDEKRIVLEILTGMKRAGADVVITYHAKDAARWLKESGGAE